ncbi:MAG: aspartate kinase [Clostridiales bacterium]|jgi:aspartate kinase|nr:aspartate kinase [Clostridiales bacterium]
MLIVQKYGGSSVAGAARMSNAAQRVAETRRTGCGLVVVLSAQGDTTDDLIAKALEINPKPPKRELDMLLSTGEQQSVALMSMAVHRLGFNAISLNAMQVGMTSSSTYGNARIKHINTERINAELERNNIVFVTGFQGVNRSNDITTLGRGGSDTTAVALAAALNADLCEIYTDVDGIFTADPRIVPTARKINAISYDEMLELASLGAKVLHNRSVELAKKYNVNLVVRSSLTRNEGTLIKEEVKLEKTLVSGLALDKDVARISVVGIKDEPGMAFKLFSILANEKICVDIILQSIGRQNTKDITFTVERSLLDDTIKIIERNKDILLYDHLSFGDQIAKLSVVGAGMLNNPGVASIMFEALFDAGVNIHMISTSEIKISVLIDERSADKAINYVHDKFADYFNA